MNDSSSARSMSPTRTLRTSSESPKNTSRHSLRGSSTNGADGSGDAAIASCISGDCCAIPPPFCATH